MDKKKLKQYKELLLNAKTNILKELEVEQEFVDHNEHGGDMVDVADSMVLNEVINRLSDLDRDKLKQIEAALLKIEDGTYGVCEGTGKKIPEPRLKAIPWTAYTVEYAAEMEKSR